MAQNHALHIPIIYRVEPISYMKDEAEKLIEQSFRETWHNESTSFNPLWGHYENLEQENELRFLIARDDGVMVGFSTLRIGRNNGTSEVEGAIHDIFVLPSYRGKIGAEMIKKSEELLFQLGCKSVTISERHVARRTGPLYQRMGYKSIQTIWKKPLGGS